MRKTNLKWISGILAILLLIGMAGCNGDTGESVTQAANQSTALPAKYTVDDLLALPEDPVTSFDYMEHNGKMIIEGCYRESEVLVIPSQIGGKEVEHISSRAFWGNSKIKAVVIPDTVVAIWEDAFQICEKLETVVIKGESLREIGETAFMSCSALTSINLPDSITRIEIGAFSGCTALREVNIPEKLEVIEPTIFCETGIETVTIPEGVTKIDSIAFAQCPSLVSVTIPASVTAIEANAFDKSKNVTISAPAGSYAETFAQENEIPFVAAN